MKPTEKKAQPVVKTPTPRKVPYEAPRIEEEEVFEREALIASCDAPFACGAPFKTSS